MPPCLIRAAAALLVLVTAACAAADIPPAPGRMVLTGNSQIFVREWGAPGAPPVLLIHGAASHSGVFEPSLAPALAADFHLYAYDRPGMGRTEDRPDVRGLAMQAAAAADVIAALDLDRPVVVAHSYGGAVALRLALDRPDLISGLVLLSPASHPWPGGVAWHYHLSGNPLLAPVFNRAIVPLAGGGAIESGLEGSFSPQPIPPDYRDTAEIDLALLPRALRANAEDMTALKGELIDQAPNYPQIAIPVAILAGDADGTVSTDIHARALDRDIPNARLVVLPGIGHMTPEVAPEQVAPLIGWVLEQAESPAQ